LVKKHKRGVHFVLIWALLLSMLLPGQVYGDTKASQPSGELQDIGGSYAQKEILELVKTGVISGYEDGTFRPAQPMTRAELAKIVSLSMGLQENHNAAKAFVDVPASSWYSGYVGALYAAGIVQGTSQTGFSPGDQVTREQLVVFFIRAMGLEKAASKYSDEPKLTDFHQVSGWAKLHVALAYQLGFIGGMDNGNGTVRFAPQEKAERQALARLAYEFMSNKEQYIAKVAELVPNEPKPTPTPTPTPSPAPTAGGSSGGSRPGGSNDDDSRAPDINQAGDVLTDYTITGAHKQTVGPASGKVTVTGTLTVNPGPEGDITLRNINAGHVVVLSGSSNSIVLNGVTVAGTLRVNASAQVDSVRIEAGPGTGIAKTDIESQVILEGKEGELGRVEVKESAAGQKVTLRGKIEQNITFAPGSTGAVLQIDAGAQVGKIIAKADIILEGHVDGVDFVADEGIKFNTSRLPEDTKNALIAAAIAKAIAKANTLPEYKDINMEHQAVIEDAWGLINGAMGLGASNDQLNAEGNITDKVNQAYTKLQDLVAFHAVYDNLVIGYHEGDSASSVTRDVYLPTSNLYGVQVTWFSENMHLVSDTGEVHRPRVDHNVRLIALLQKGSINGTKEFALKVVGLGNHSPAAKSVAEQRLTLGQLHILKASDLASDEDANDTLTVSSAVYETPGIIHLSPGGESLYISPLAVGSTTVTASIYDGIASVDVSFTVTVVATAPANQAPIARPVEGKTLTVAGAPIIVSADELAIDPEGQQLTITNVSANPTNAVNVVVKDGVLEVAPLAAGTSTVTVTVEDSEHALVNVIFGVTVVEAASEIILEYLGHSSFVLTSSEQKVLIDPWMPGPFGLPHYQLANESSINLVTVSHEHEDHNYIKVAPTAVRDGNILRGITVDPETFDTSFHPIQNESRGDITIHTVNVPHFGESDPAPAFMRPNAAFIYETAGMRIVHLGDGMAPILEGFTEELANSLKGNSGIDVLMIPVGDSMGRAMNSSKVIEAIQALAPKVAIPMHPWNSKQQFLDAARNSGLTVVDQQSKVNFSAIQLPNNHTAIWNMTALADTVMPNNLILTGRNGATAELSFSLPELTFDTSITLQQSSDGGRSWSDASTSTTLTNQSNSATVTNLVPETTYLFRLEIIQGALRGYSNISLLAKLGVNKEQRAVVATDHIIQAADFGRYSKLEVYMGYWMDEFTTAQYSIDITGDIAKGSSILENMEYYSISGNVWYRLVDNQGNSTVWLQDGSIPMAPVNDSHFDGEFVVLGDQGLIKVINSVGQGNRVNGYQAIVVLEGGPTQIFELKTNEDTILSIDGGLKVGDKLRLGYIDTNGNVSAYSPEVTVTVDFQ
jgi:L-ascorbate metabolism protein UlaG (beta-lactamase superfamily)